MHAFRYRYAHIIVLCYAALLCSTAALMDSSYKIAESVMPTETQPTRSYAAYLEARRLRVPTVSDPDPFSPDTPASNGNPSDPFNPTQPNPLEPESSPFNPAEDPSVGLDPDQDKDREPGNACVRDDGSFDPTLPTCVSAQTPTTSGGASATASTTDAPQYTPDLYGVCMGVDMMLDSSLECYSSATLSLATSTTKISSINATPTLSQPVSTTPFIGAALKVLPTPSYQSWFLVFCGLPSLLLF